MDIRLSFIFLLCLIFVTGCSHYHYDTEYTDAQGKKETNIWPKMANNFNLNTYADHPEVKKQIQWYMNHQDYLIRTAQRAAPYMYYIHEQLTAHDMPDELVLLPIVESAYNPFVYSPTGAAGIWQFMPGTASGYGVKQDWWYDGRRDIFSSTQAALDFLNTLNEYFNGDWLLTIAAYNAGEGTVASAMRHNQRLGLPTDFWDLKLPAETKGYVPTFLALCEIVSHPYEYPVNWPKIPNKPYFETITIVSQINLEKASEAAGISLDELRHLNPGYNHSITPPEGVQTITVPADKANQFKTSLASLDKNTIIWQHYIVQHGDKLTSLAASNHTTPTLIKRVNNLLHDALHPNQELLIPAYASKLSAQEIAAMKPYLHSVKHPGPTEIIYTVKKHDSIDSIAHLYHVNKKDLLYWNQMKEDFTLTPGQSLIIWITPQKQHKRSHRHLHRS